MTTGRINQVTVLSGYHQRPPTEAQRVAEHCTRTEAATSHNGVPRALTEGCLIANLEKSTRFTLHEAG